MAIILKVNGREYRKWESVNVTLNLNTVASTFEFTTFVEESTLFLFQPNAWIECEVWIEDVDKKINEPLITGYIVNQGMSRSKLPSLSTITGMSRPGILEKCNMPKSLYPLQWTNVSLAYLSRMVCEYFDLKLDIHSGATKAANKIFEDVECKPNESVKEFLSRYAKDVGITVSHDNLGRLFLYRIVNIDDATSEVLSREETDRLLFSIKDIAVRYSISPDCQEVHTECLVLKDKDVTASNEDPTINNNDKDWVLVKSPFVINPNIKLPKTVVLTENQTESLYSYGAEELAREARAFPITIEKEGWVFADIDIKRDTLFRVVRAGFYLIVECEEILYEETKVVVENMQFTKSATGVEQLTMTCILPCVYTGKLPAKSPFKRLT